MMKNKHLLKNKNILGMTLIETIVSMWILGIVIVSMLSFIGASVSKQNQLKIQAMSLAKSELQEAELDVRNQKEHNHYTLLLLKSSYLTEADKNYESNIENDIAENESGFYTKYVSIDGTNWNEIDSTHLEIQSLNKKGAAFSNNSINDEPINLVRPIEKVANNFEGVEKSYAIQAGREIRIIVKPEFIDDTKSVLLARDIVKQIEEELEYPGQIKVTVIRETRAVDYAK